MAVTFDTSAQGKANAPATSFTITITIGTGANQAAAVGLMFGNNAVSGIGITGGGGGAWSLVSGSDTGASFSVRTMIFQATGLASGAQTLTVSWTTASEAGGLCCSCFNVNQTTPLLNGAQQGSAGASTDTIVITSTLGDLTMDMWGDNNTIGFPTLPTQTSMIASGTTNFGFAASRGTGAATVSHGWTTNSSQVDVIAHSGADFNAVRVEDDAMMAFLMRPIDGSPNVTVYSAPEQHEVPPQVYEPVPVIHQPPLFVRNW